MSRDWPLDQNALGCKPLVSGISTAVLEAACLVHYMVKTENDEMNQIHFFLFIQSC